MVVLRDDSDPASGAGTLAEIRVIENPALAASDGAAWEEPSGASAEVAQDDAADEPPMDRETFRLANLGVPPPTREDILLELGDPDTAARVAAVPLVGSLGPRAAIGILSDVFAQDEDPLVRSRGVAALTRLDGPDARRLLRERALADDDAGLRMQALNALDQSEGERAINVLAQALRQDPESKVRMTAIRAFGRVGGAWARRAPGAGRPMDLDPEVRLAAEEALATSTRTSRLTSRWKSAGFADRGVIRCECDDRSCRTLGLTTGRAPQGRSRPTRRAQGCMCRPSGADQASVSVGDDARSVQGCKAAITNRLF